METRLQIGETAEQRRIRERNRVEEADNDLTEDLFGASGGGAQGAGGIAAVPLKSMQVSGGLRSCGALSWMRPAPWMPH